ncbi:MAG TPA: ABC transporter ATP-binding protein [Dehalococcoidia bacterium]
MDLAVVAQGVRVSRGGREVLLGLDLGVRAGTVTGLLGPSGCGKTTLLRSIVGVQRGVSGVLSILGLPAGESALRGRVGYMPQSPALYNDLSIEENLQFFAAVLRTNRTQVERVLEQVALTPLAGRLVGTLSGGQRARVSLATALLGGPALLILDEPTVGLDPLLRADLWRTFHSLADGGQTLIVSSHVMDEAAHCDNLLLMREGRLLADGTPDDLLKRTRTGNLEAAFVSLIQQGNAE